MKKIAALTLVLVMVLALCACGGSGSDGKSSAVGTWTIKTMTNGGETYNVDDVPALKDFIVMELREDGTGTITSSGETTPLTWDGSNITVEGDPASYTVSGDTLTLTSDSYTFTFVRK
jgi:hypothetical protein